MLKEVDELKLPGVYVLYRGDEVYYIGKTETRLWNRLYTHSNKVTSERYAHWDYFSAFALNTKVENPSQKIAELEAVLIAAIPRAGNSAKPKFKRVQIPKKLRNDDAENT